MVAIRDDCSGVDVRTVALYVFEGYMTQVLGVKSPCRFREISHLSPGNYTTTIVPALPMLEVKTSLPKTESFCSMEDGECVVTSGSLSLHAGQR